ncbi:MULTISPECIES: hypothetical protein [unclassified Sphingobium]|uniref:hypothetical protein n=1 Tax=unclassified Sphingobium TaxID=2611147 RepID=UPI002223FC04|nr:MULTISPECIES: hypothetical protein [unclassified Sphingobium]MCW2412809.1 hypothetical protein [Sphingobium sp. B8D3D]MCW2414893.1 hypothetical protein [Sphingobium sp. B8D3A]
MTRDLSALFAFRDLRSFPLTAMHLIMAARLCIIYGQSGRDPVPDLAVRLRSMDAARRVILLVRGLQEGWPEHFLVHRPCAMSLSPDEALLGDLAVTAIQGDEAEATRLLRETLPWDVTHFLFHQTVAAVAAIRSAQLQPHRPENRCGC